MLDGREVARRHPAELLGRPQLNSPIGPLAQRFRDRRVLITGAGGSVGPALAGELLGATPERLFLLDHHEASLWALHSRFGSAPGVELALADVRNGERMREAFERWKPDAVFHLAAYKHVPFGEVFSNETFEVNVLGTRQLLQLAEQTGVSVFVYPSSDKACNPPSLYGATKRLSEVLVRRAARRAGRAYNVARFVNILGTQGSVIELFARQAAAGTSLTVTDAAMTRYWISMDEAVWLLLSTASMEGGQVLMLDARDEVSVVEMARRVLRLTRGEGSSCDIAYGVPRPGERLAEELLSASERFEPGPTVGLLRVLDSRESEHLAIVEQAVDDLSRLAGSGTAGDLREAVMAAARLLQ